MNNVENFKEEVRCVLSGYLPADEDMVNYLVAKIARLHEEYSNKEELTDD